MSLALWLGEDRKCSAVVVGLDLMLGLGTLRYTTARCYYGYFGRDGIG